MRNRMPPRNELTALRAMYVIVNEPAPTLKDHERWSVDFYNFVACCLQKVWKCSFDTDVDVDVDVDIYRYVDGDIEMYRS